MIFIDMYSIKVKKVFPYSYNASTETSEKHMSRPRENHHCVLCVKYRPGSAKACHAGLPG